MSSYLLAFVIGEYDYIEERDSNGVLVRVYTPVGKSNLGQFALDVSCEDDRMNKWSEDYAYRGSQSLQNLIAIS